MTAATGVVTNLKKSQLKLQYAQLMTVAQDQMKVMEQYRVDVEEMKKKLSVYRKKEKYARKYVEKVTSGCFRILGTKKADAAVQTDLSLSVHDKLQSTVDCILQKIDNLENSSKTATFLQIEPAQIPADSVAVRAVSVSIEKTSECGKQLDGSERKRKSPVRLERKQPLTAQNKGALPADSPLPKRARHGSSPRSTSDSQPPRTPQRPQNQPTTIPLKSQHRPLKMEPLNTEIPSSPPNALSESSQIVDGMDVRQRSQTQQLLDVSPTSAEGPGTTYKMFHDCLSKNQPVFHSNCPVCTQIIASKTKFGRIDVTISAELLRLTEQLQSVDCTPPFDEDLLLRKSVQRFNQIDFALQLQRIDAALTSSLLEPLPLLPESGNPDKTPQFRQADVLARRCLSWMRLYNAAAFPVELPSVVQNMIKWYSVLPGVSDLSQSILDSGRLRPFHELLHSVSHVISTRK